MLKVFGRGAVSDFLGDRVVYRNLAPLDPGLPGLEDVRAGLDLPVGRTPRKSEPDYARVIVRFLEAAQRERAPGAPLKRLIFIGDTRMNDATAFANLCAAGEWPGLAFICAETGAAPAREIISAPGGQPVFLANRWAALNGSGDESLGFEPFDVYCLSQGFPIDEQAVVVVDLDKTALGARGRNARVIDAARVQAVQETVAGALGPVFDDRVFRKAYDTLNEQEFHPFTGDNQDYLAYICLILGSGMYDLDTVVNAVRSGELRTFRAFIEGVEARFKELDSRLGSLHREIFANVQTGDPTPFKRFRRTEYRATVGRMGFLPDSAPLEQLLAEEIVLTNEVRTLAGTWRAQGALLFGLSDKPDEASIPTSDLAASGWLPLHRKATHIVGA